MDLKYNMDWNTVYLIIITSVKGGRGRGRDVLSGFFCHKYKYMYVCLAINMNF